MLTEEKEVKGGERLIKFSPEIISQNGLGDIVITVFTNSDSF
ncbi:hypothetical protein [Sporolactobacillus pectinivorans]